LDYPQVDEWLIKALEATLAPFVQPEKPQVFPSLATSFIRSGADIPVPGGGQQAPPSHPAQIRRVADGTVMPVLIEVFCDDLTQSGRASRAFERPSAAPPGLGMMLLIFTAAPVRRFRFGLHRHKYAT